MFESVGKVPVKGKEHPQEAYELIKTSEVETRIEAAAAKGLTKFVGRHPEMEVHKRIRFPSIRGFFPEHIGLLDDPRLGFHHTTISTATVDA